MRLIILAASSDDGLDWLDRFVDTSNIERTGSGAVDDVYDTRAMIICPESYDQLDVMLDPNDPAWLARPTTKIIRTDQWIFDQRVVSALSRLRARHPLLDPTSLLGPSDDQIAAHRGWVSDGRTAPMGVSTQRMRPRSKVAPRRSGSTGAGVQLPR